jgi:putative ABC transport system permease protein
MILRDLINRAGRSLRSAKGRTILTALAIAVGTFALTLTMAASNGATAFVGKIIAENFDPSELIVTADESIFGRGDTTKPREYDPNFGMGIANSGATTQVKLLTEEDITKLRAIEGVESVREDLQVNLRYITREDQKKYVATAATFNPAQKPELVAGSIPQPLDGGRVLLPEGYISALGFSSAEEAIGKTVTFSVQKPLSPNEVMALTTSGATPAEIANRTQANLQQFEYNIAAVMRKPTTAQPGTDLYLYIGADDARKLNDITTTGSTNYRKFNYVFVKVKDGTNEKIMTEMQDKIKNLGFISQSVKETQEFLTNIIGVLQGIVAAFGAIAIIASVFGIVNTMYISVLQRTREIGLMKALGMRKQDIGHLFRFEAAWIGLIGGVIGSLTAIILGVLINPWITEKINLGEGNSLLIFRPIEIIILILILMLVSILAGWLPSRKAAKLDPIEALRTE